MKTGVRFPPRLLIILAGLFSAIFILTSSPLVLPEYLSSARAESFDQRLARAKTRIELLIKNGTYVPALRQAKLYVRLSGKKYGTRHPNYARALQLLAKVYRYLKRPVEAKKFERRAAVILKNHRNFTAKRDADIKATRAKAERHKREIRARMLRERRAQRSAKTLQYRRAQQPPPLAKQKQTARPVIQQQKKPTAARKAPPQRQLRAAKPERSFQYQAEKRNTRTLRAPPKTATRQKSVAPGDAPPSKVVAPPLPPLADVSPPVVVPRSLNAGPTGGSSPRTFSDNEIVSPEIATAPAASAKNHTIVKVYYATDRQRTNSLKLAGLFGGQPSDPRRISYGICEVSIPKGHKPGVLEAPSIWRFEFKEDPDKHVVLLKVHAQEKRNYFRNLKSIIDRSKGQNAFIFIHGYNVTFSDAARRTAQIAYDLGFDGAPVFYSWPSAGELGGYPTDEDNVAWAQENVKEFLKDFVEQTNAKNIYLVAHSMGSRALTGAVASLVAEQPKFKKRFKEIILAAPDISARIFRDNIAPKMIEASNNITLYVSGDDKALMASRKFHANPRAGETGKSMIIFKGIDTIDATGIDASLLAHSYFAEAKSIIADIVSIFRGEPASGRKTLKQVQTERGAYWAFTK